MKHTVGIDPGKTGGLVALNDKGNVVGLLRMPAAIHGNDHVIVDGAQVAAFLRHWDPALIVVEDVYSSPQMGVVGAFSFGASKGVLLGVIGTLGMEARTIWPSPVGWKGKLGLLLGPNTLSKAQRRKALKKLSIAKAQRMFPGIKDMAHDGIAEAALLAAFGLLTARRGR